MLAQWLT